MVDDDWTDVVNNDNADKDVVDIDMDDGQEEKKEPDDESSEEVDIDADMDAMNNALKQGAQANTDNIFANMVQDQTGGTSSSAAGNDNIKKVRMYDLSITYDLWTQTPRLWL